jgi:hypothetical protein
VRNAIPKHSQKNEILASVSPTTIPGALQIIIFLLPILSIHLRAISVKIKFVPDTIRPTAVGWLNPISLNKVAE